MKNNSPSKPTIKSAWQTAWKSRSFRIQFIVTMLILASFSGIFNQFFDYVESRSGPTLKDFVHDFIAPHNVSWIVFFFLYSGLVIGISYHLSSPRTILIMFQTYVIITLVRICTITCMPLNPPDGYIPLREPFVQFFTNGGKIISKDLFFSGHMSTILSVFYPSRNKKVKRYVFLCATMIGLMVIVQHVHYTIDVIFAVPATYFVYLICKKYFGGKNLNNKLSER